MRGAALLALVLAAAAPAAAERVRFSPGPDTPVAYDSTAGLYREAASFDPLYCAEEPCIELLHNIFKSLVATAADQTIEARWPHLVLGPFNLLNLDRPFAGQTLPFTRANGRTACHV